MANIKDVARLAGVSISTVSYVLSGERPVSEATKELVLQAMERLGYRPHAHARALASKRSRILALHIPLVRKNLGETMMEFVTSASEAVKEYGYNLVLWTSGYNEEAALTQLVRQGLVDGMILMEVHTQDPRVPLLQKLDLPFSLIGRSRDSDGEADSGTVEDISWADIDFRSTMFSAVEHLYALGHRHIAFVSQSKEAFDQRYGPVVRSYRAFIEAQGRYGFTGPQLFCEESPQMGYRLFKDVIERNPGITGVIVMNDRILPGIYRAILESGHRIPEQYSVISIVSSPGTAEMFYPAVSAAEVPGRQLARIAVERLIERLEGKAVDHSKVLIPCNLVIRESTGPISRGKRTSHGGTSNL